MIKNPKILYIISFVLFFIGQGMNFSVEFQIFNLFTIVFVILSGLMVYRKSKTSRVEIFIFVVSFAFLFAFGLYVLFFGFIYNSIIEVILYIIGIANLFFLFRVTSLNIE